MRSTKSLSWIKRLAGFGASRVPPHVFALNGERLRYARFDLEPRGFELREYLVEEVEPGLFPDGQLAGPARDAHRLHETVSRLLARSDSTVEEASLVLPDRWLRVASTDADDVPRRRREREEVIRFKLRRLVPFRIEDLRVAAVESASLVEQQHGRRILLGFASQALLEQLEEVFAGNGVRLGQISNEGLALLNALQPSLSGQEVGVLLRAGLSSYGLVVSRWGFPVLHRFKSLTEGEPNWDLIVRDLRLTRSFVATQAEAVPLGEVLFVGPSEFESDWHRALESAFEVPVRNVAREWGELPGTIEGVPVEEGAPLFGAAGREVY